MKREEAREYAMMALMACEGIASVHLCKDQNYSRYPVYEIYAMFKDGSKRWLCFSYGCHYENFPSVVHVHALSEDDGEDDIWKSFAECYLYGGDKAPKYLVFIKDTLDGLEFVDVPHGFTSKSANELRVELDLKGLNAA